jgi:hypothetical protein
MEWHRSGNLLYTLEQVGWRKGEPVEQNRLTVRVDGGPNATKEEIDALTDRLAAFLALPAPVQEG